MKDLDSSYLRHLSCRTKAQEIMALVNNGERWFGIAPFGQELEICLDHVINE